MTSRLTGASGPFVGRARELAAVAEVMASSERTGVALIGGEAGMGKTRLVEEIVAAHPDSAVVRGGAVPRATPLPFELVRTAVEPTARSRAQLPETIAPLVEAAHSVLLDQAPPDGSNVPTADQVRAVAEILRGLSDGPTIFVFDDVHWSDPESLDVIDRLMVTGPLAGTVLVTYRPEALRPRHPVNAFLQRAERRAHAVQIRLEPLRRDEVAQFVSESGHHVDDRTVEHLHSRTGGNPLLLSELVGTARSDHDLTGPLPWTLAEILRPEIDRLPAGEREVAEAVAVLGAEADFDLVAAAVAVDERELLDRLRRLVDSGILVESEADRFGFRHELVREAVSEGLFTRERRRIHAAAHDALLEAGSTDEVALVHHASEAGRIKQAADAARQAARNALARGSSHQALAFAEQALLVHSDDLEVLRVAVVAGWMTDQLRTALDHVDRWSDLVGADPELGAEVLHWRVRLLWQVGDTGAADSAARQLEAVIARLQPGPALVQAQADLAQHRMLSGDFEEAIEIADQALGLAGEVGARGPALQARAERAAALSALPAHRESGLVELAAVADEAEALGDYILASRVLHNTPVLAARTDPRRHLERMRSASRRAGLTCVATEGYRLALLEIAAADGDRDEYEAVLDAALGDLGTLPEVLVTAVLYRLGIGDLEEASRLADRLLSPTRSSGLHVSDADRAGVRSLVDFASTGDTDGLRAWLDAGRLTEYHSMVLLDHLDLLVDGGLADQVLRVIERSERGELTSCCHAPALAAVGAELRGDHREAERLYSEVLGSGERRRVVEAAQLEMARARVARARGTDPAPFLRSAAQRLNRWPGRLRDRVETAIGDPPDERAGPAVLTPREREVAELVARGLTNGGIADQLFISTKTASVHVSNILAKLGMTSRTEIAAWAAGGGLSGPG